METLRHLLDDFVVISVFIVVIYYMQLLERRDRVEHEVLQWARRLSLGGMVAGLLLLAYWVTTGEITLLLPGYVIGLCLIGYFVSQVLIIRHRSSRAP